MVGVGFAAVKALGVAGQFASGLMSAQARQAEFADQLRSLEFKKEQTLGVARSRAAASGIEMGSASTVDYLAGLTGQFDQEIASLRRLKRMTGEADQIAAYSTLLGGGADTYLGVAQANNFWR